MSPSETALDQLAELPATVDRLTQEIVVLRTVMDEIREDIGWAVRNAPDTIPSLGATRITSMALDPCAPDWSERLNRLTPADLPSGPEIPKSQPSKVLVRAEDFAKAMENVEQLVYCCESPDLQWTGEPDSPSIECQNCGFMVLDSGNAVMRPTSHDSEVSAEHSTALEEQGHFDDQSDEESADEEMPVEDHIDEEETSDAESSHADGGPIVPTSPATETPRRKPTQPLSMRLIFQPHMTDLVRVFGYATLSAEEAKRRAEPLIEKYGRDRLADAAAEIVEEVANPPRHYRLTDEARRIAVQILGRPPAPSPAAENAVAADYKAPLDEAGEESPTASIPETENPPPERRGRLSPAIAAAMYRQHLSELGVKWIFVAPETLRELSGRRRLAPDLIVTGDDRNQLVAVRQRLSAKQRQQISEWFATFGPDCEAVRVWPRKNGDEYDWQSEIVSVPRDNKLA